MRNQPNERRAARPQGRRAWVWLFRLGPAAGVLLLLVWSAYDVWRLNRLDHDEVQREVIRYLEEKQGTEFPFFDHYFDLDPADRHVFVYGASSVVLSGGADGAVFSQYLQALLNRDSARVRVTNLGIPGIDSFSVLRRVEMSLLAINASVQPDLVVIYAGHNDYTNPYMHIVAPRYRAFEWLLWLGRIVTRDKLGPIWYPRHQMPRVLLGLQRLRLVNFEDVDYGEANRAILEYFARNVARIDAMLAAQGIPVVWITPIGNVEAEPYGPLSTTRRLYREGMATRDYRERMRLLFAARDAEVFTMNMRAKTPLLEFLRGRTASGALVLDLEAKLLERRFGFGNEDFLDRFHLRDGTHLAVAALLARAIEETPELARALDRE